MEATTPIFAGVTASLILIERSAELGI